MPALPVAGPTKTVSLPFPLSALPGMGAGDARDAAASRPKLPLPAAENAADVLYVEDSDSWAVLVGDWTMMIGMKLHRTRTVKEFLGYLDSCAKLPRCIVIDILLGDENGLHLCDRLKRDPRLQSIPIILLTGVPISAQESFKHRAIYCIIKSDTALGEYTAALQAILEQQERSQGVIDAGLLRLDARDGSVSYDGRRIATLDASLFEALRLLVQASAKPVSESDLARALAARSRDPRPKAAAVRPSIDRLRERLGADLAARIVPAEGGYALLLDPFA